MAIIEIADFQYQNVNIIVYWILWNIIGHWLYRGSVSDNPTGIYILLCQWNRLTIWVNAY